jgi:hypothetical protein
MMRRIYWKTTTSQIEVWAPRKRVIEKNREAGHRPGQVEAQRLEALLAVVMVAIY